MQLKISSILISAILMTNFSAIAQSLDKRPVNIKQIPQLAAGKGLIKNSLLEKTAKAGGSPLSPADPKNSNKTLNSNGGVGTGGGNMVEDPNIGNERAVRLIENAKLSTRYALRSLEMSLDTFNYAMFREDSKLDPETSERLQSINKKLFGGKTTIYEALQKAVLQPQLAGPCLDREGHDVDGSAKDAPILCFSVERLAHLKSYSAQREIIALVAHEVSHMVGTDEAEATILQFMVRSNLSSMAIERTPELVDNYTRDFEYAISNAQALRKLANEGNSKFVCKIAGNFMADLNTLLQTNMNSNGSKGIVFLRPNETKILLGALMKSMNIMAYCMSPDQDYMDMLLVFKGRHEISLQEMNKEMANGHTHIMPVPNWKIRNIKKVKGGLTAELNDILNALTTVHENMQ